MKKAKRDPLQSLLLTRAEIYIKKVGNLINSLGSVDWEQWQLTFDTLESINDVDVLYNLINDIAKLSYSIYDINERIFVLSTVLKTAILKEVYLTPKDFISYVETLLNWIFENPRSLESASALAKIWFAADKFGEKDILDEIEKIIENMIMSNRAKESWLADFYSELGSLLSNIDISTSEKYLKEAVEWANKLDDYEKWFSLARIAVRYKYAIHSPDTEQFIFSLIENIIEEIDFNDPRNLRQFFELSIYLHKIKPEVVEDIIKRVYLKVISVSDEREKIFLLQSLLRALAFIGLDDLKTKVLDVLMSSLNLLDGSGLFNPFVSSLLVRYGDLAIGFRIDMIETLLDDIIENFSVYANLDNIEITSIIIDNLMNSDYELTTKRLSEIIGEKLKNMNCEERELLEILSFLKAIKKVAPKLANSEAVKIAEKFYAKVCNIIVLEPVIVKMFSEISKQAFNKILYTVLNRVEEFDKVTRSEILANVLPYLYKVDKMRFNTLMEEYEEELSKLNIMDRIDIKRKLAENFIDVSIEESKYWYRKTIRDCEVLRKKNKARALKEIAKTIKSIENKMGDTVWSRQLKSYYLSLDVFLEN